MTELETHIYNCAKKVLSQAKERIKKLNPKPKTEYIKIPFYCDGCFDFLVYDIKQKKFTKIEYRYGKDWRIPKRDYIYTTDDHSIVKE